MANQSSPATAITVTIIGKSSLGSISALRIGGHPDINSMLLCTDYGSGDPEWPQKQGVPSITFAYAGTDLRDHSAKASHVAAALSSTSPPIPMAGSAEHCVILQNFADLARALKCLGFDEQSTSLIVKMADDVQKRHESYRAGITEEDVASLKDLDARKRSLDGPVGGLSEQYRNAEQIIRSRIQEIEHRGKCTGGRRNAMW